MKKFIVDKSFWDLFPNSMLGVILIKNMQNSNNSPKEVQDILKKANKDAYKHLEFSSIFSENPAIKVWRDTFQKFKTKKGARSSIEALLKRVEKDNEVNSINILVDLYNAISLEFGLPCGAEDIKKINGNLILGITNGGDEFYPLGEEENSPTLPNEVCYYDSQGAVCRCLNWRDGERTMIDENTKDAFLIMECVDETQFDALKNAINKMSNYAQKYLNANCKTHFLTKQNSEIIIEN